MASDNNIQFRLAVETAAFDKAMRASGQSVQLVERAFDDMVKAAAPIPGLVERQRELAKALSAGDLDGAERADTAFALNETTEALRKQEEAARRAAGMYDQVVENLEEATVVASAYAKAAGDVAREEEKLRAAAEATAAAERAAREAAKVDEANRRSALLALDARLLDEYQQAVIELQRTEGHAAFQAREDATARRQALEAFDAQLLREYEAELARLTFTQNEFTDAQQASARAQSNVGRGIDRFIADSQRGGGPAFDQETITTGASFLERLSGAAKEAAGAFGAVDAKVQDATKGIAGLSSIIPPQVQQWVALGGVIGIAAGAVTGLVAATVELGARGDEIAKTARAMNIGIRDAQVLSRSLELGGASDGDKVLSRLVKRLGEAQAGIGRTRQALTAMGVNLEELRDIPLEKQMFVLAEALQNVNGDAVRLGLALKVLGTEEVRLAGTFAQGVEAIKANIALAARAGFVTREYARSAEFLSDRVTLTQQAFENFTANAVGPLISSVTALADTSVLFLSILNKERKAVDGLGSTFEWVFDNIVWPALLTGVKLALDFWAGLRGVGIGIALVGQQFENVWAVIQVLNKGIQTFSSSILVGFSVVVGAAAELVAKLVDTLTLGFTDLGSEAERFAARINDRAFANLQQNSGELEGALAALGKEMDESSALMEELAQAGREAAEDLVENEQIVDRLADNYARIKAEVLEYANALDNSTEGTRDASNEDEKHANVLWDKVNAYRAIKIAADEVFRTLSFQQQEEQDDLNAVVDLLAKQERISRLRQAQLRDLIGLYGAETVQRFGLLKVSEELILADAALQAQEEQRAKAARLQSEAIIFDKLRLQKLLDIEEEKLKKQQEQFEALIDLLNDLADAWATVFDAVADSIDAFPAFNSETENLRDSLSGLASDLGGLVATFTDVFEKFGGGFEGTFRGIAATVGEVMQAVSDAVSSTLIANAEDAYERSIARLEDLRDRRREIDEEITNATTREQRTRLEREKQSLIEQSRLHARAAQQQAENAKAAALVGAIINTAGAIIKAVATASDIYSGLALSITAGALGAVQIGAIASQPVPNFQTLHSGGPVFGARDERLVNGIEGEVMVPRRTVQAVGGPEAFSNLNFDADGGQSLRPYSRRHRTEIVERDVDGGRFIDERVRRAHVAGVGRLPGAANPNRAYTPNRWGRG